MKLIFKSRKKYKIYKSIVFVEDIEHVKSIEFVKDVRYVETVQYTKNEKFLFYFLYLYCILVYRTITNLVRRERSVDSKSLLNIVLSYILILYS